MVFTNFMVTIDLWHDTETLIFINRELEVASEVKSEKVEDRSVEKKHKWQRPYVGNAQPGAL